MRPGYIKTAAKLFLLYSLLWAVLSFGSFDLFVLLFITLLSLATPLLFAPLYLRVNGFALLKLLLFFLYNSFKSALLLSRLALRRDHCLTPSVYTLKLETKSEIAAIALANIYSLMPGTLSMDLQKSTLELHIIDESLFDEAFLFDVQNRVIKALEGRG